MAWKILKTNELPLSARTLQVACSGADVRELQERLRETGFYTGKVDGFYGVLTMEAVSLWQRAFHLPVDGIAGPRVFWTLDQYRQNTGFIIHTVAPGDTLASISRQYKVHPSAWKSLYGHGNPRQRIFAGMRLLLPQQALFLWQENQAPPLPSFFDNNAIGIIHSGWRITPEREILPLIESFYPGHFYLLEAETEALASLSQEPKLWVEMVHTIKKQLPGNTVRFGIDLRQAPIETIQHWPDGLKTVRNKLPELHLIVLPLPLLSEKHDFLSTSRLSRFLPFCHRLALAPVPDFRTPEKAIGSFTKLSERLLELCEAGFSSRILLLLSTDGWEWSLTQNQYRIVPQREIRIIRAMNFRSQKPALVSDFLTMLKFHRRREDHCLLYLDERDWPRFLKFLTRFHLDGMILRRFQALPSSPEIIARSFAVKPDGV